MAKLLSKLRYKSRSTKKRYNLLESPTKEVTTPEVDLHMGGIINFFSTMSQTEILEYCLGFDKQGAPRLAEHIILVALKYRTLDDEPYPLLEVGLHFIHRCDAKNELDNPGPHSLNILRQISYRHMIMEDNARHANRLPDPREMEINHFGATRFVSMGDAKDILEQIFRTPAAIYSPTGRKSYLACPCPIVMLNYDTPQWPALEKAFEIDPFIAYNIVATIDTKCIACEPGNPWSSDTLTLSKLTQELKIEYPAQQSASDQAAYALIDAIQLVMRPKVPLAIESIRSVVNTTMLHSQCDTPYWGEENFCTVCGEHNHRRLKCRVLRNPINKCWKCVSAGIHGGIHTHKPEMCPFSQPKIHEV